MISDAATEIQTLTAEGMYVAARVPELVRVPEQTLLMVDGHGDPNTSPEYKAAIEALYGLSYTLKFRLKKELGLSYRVSPLESLWWADEMAEFSSARKADWRWTAMIAQPSAVTPVWFVRASGELRRRKGVGALDRTRLEGFDEGLVAQILYLGPYSDEGPTIERLHAFIRERGCTFDGRLQKHHEIYLGDPRRAAPERLRTIIRQPVAAP